MKGVLLLLLAFSICFTRASTSIRGQCPQPSLQQNFTLRKYMGTWFEIQRLPTAFVQGRCTAERYTLLPDGWIKLLSQEVMKNGSVATFEGDIVSASVNETAKLQFKAFKGGAKASRHFTDFPELSFIPYWVLSTDYTSYSLVYSCRIIPSFLLKHKEYAWILSRERHLHENTTNYLRDILISNNININDMIISDQEVCPSYT